MRNKEKYLSLVITIVMILSIITHSYAINSNNLEINKEVLGAGEILGICKIYRDDDTFYYKKDSEGKYSKSVTLEEVQNIRNAIKQEINNLGDGEYLIGKILKSTTYYNETYKEFCYKRPASSVTTDNLEKVIILGYDDTYQFRSGLTTSTGAYKVKKVGETEEFYVSYDDTWLESELIKMCDANGVVLDKQSIEMEIGETVEVKYTVLPENTLSKGVRVAYSGGIEIDTSTFGTIKIKAVEDGDAYIIVKLKSNENISAQCNIKVVSNQVTPTPVITPSIKPTPVITPSIKPTPVITPSIKPTPTVIRITSDIYQIDVLKKYISMVSPGTSINDFKSNIISNVEYKITDKNGNDVADTNTIATGMKLKTANQEYTIIVKGDTNGDGKISISDVIMVRLCNIKKILPNEIEKNSADVNNDGKVSISDVIIVRLANVRKIEL